MNKIEQQFIKQLGPNYDKTQKPHVYFFDHAVEDAALSEKSQRPRFKNAVYISKQSRTKLRDKHQRKAVAEDFEEFPAEFEYYRKVKDNLAKPRISLLPEIDEATKAEMRALQIFALDELIAHEGDCFGEWKQLARRLIDAIENKAGSEEREDLPGDAEQPPVGVLEANIKSNPIRKGADYQGQKPEMTFNYEWNL